MNIPRLRIVAGPNGSGKTTLTRYLVREHSLSFGVYINADEIEQKLKKAGLFLLSDYNLITTKTAIQQFFAEHPLNTNQQETAFTVTDNQLRMTAPVDGYFAAVLADYLRKRLVDRRISFSFETVMSSADKIALMQTARKKGYRNYLYYVCTDDVLINKERIAGRIQMGEHGVPEDKIVSRYNRSLSLLLDAIKISDRAYLFDNSGRSHELIAEVIDGHVINMKENLVPSWFMSSVINKLNN